MSHCPTQGGALNAPWAPVGALWKRADAVENRAYPKKSTVFHVALPNPGRRALEARLKTAPTQKSTVFYVAGVRAL